jgi:hypothetical protein
MGDDEVGTLRALTTHRRELVDPAIARHHGRIVKTTGDGMLVEFHSIVDAVACAVAVQRGMVGRNATVPEDRRIVFRIGINLGDILIDGDDIFGDGVNVAARLEALCEPGGVCISRAANEQIRDKVSLAFADFGERKAKNIAHSIGVFGLAAGTSRCCRKKSARDGRSPRCHRHGDQQIHFCRTADGVQLAMRAWAGATSGQGWRVLDPPRRSGKSIWRHLWRDLARDHTVIRYDARAMGYRTGRWTTLVRCLRAGSGDRGRCRRPRPLPSARHLAGLCRLDRLRRSRTPSGSPG